MSKRPSGQIPRRPIIAADAPHAALFSRVRRALEALPSFFDSPIVIAGLDATDIVSFNTSLGSAIENQAVSALNRLRTTWDPEQAYVGYSFVRQSQTFPDVVLRRESDPNADPLMGIELKGWFLLAKEGEPSLRFTTTPAVCAPQDLLVVFPWALSDVISGQPRLFSPWIESARYVAEIRNHDWASQESTGKKGEIVDRSIALSTVSTPYPRKSQRISDEPASDKGGNFGRIVRPNQGGRLIQEFVTRAMATPLAGVEARLWVRFLEALRDGMSAEDREAEVERVARSIRSDSARGS